MYYIFVLFSYEIGMVGIDQIDCNNQTLIIKLIQSIDYHYNSKNQITKYYPIRTVLLIYNMLNCLFELILQIGRPMKHILLKQLKIFKHW